MPTLLERDQNQDVDPLDRGTPYDDSSGWRTNVGEQDSTSDLEDQFNAPSATDDDLPEGHPSRSNNSLDGDDLNQLDSNRGNTGEAGKNPVLQGEDRLGGSANYTGKALGQVLANSSLPLSVGGRVMAVMRTRKGQAAGIGGALATVAFTIFAISTSTMSSEYFTKNFMYNTNKGANRVLQKRVPNSVIKQMRKIPGRVASRIEANLAKSGVDVVKNAAGEVESLATTTAKGERVLLNVADADPVGQAVARAGNEAVDDIISKIEPSANIIAETTRGEAAASWFSRFKVNRANWLDSNKIDPDAEPAKQLEQAVEHADDNLRNADKPTVNSGSTEFKDPNEVTDSNGKTSTTTTNAQEAAEQFKTSVDDFTGGDLTKVAEAERAASKVEAVGDDLERAFAQGVAGAETVAKVAPEIVAETAETVAKDVAEMEAKGAGTGVGQVLAGEACSTKGMIDKVGNVRTTAYALELARFAFKFGVFADTKALGFSTAKQNALIGLWMNRPGATGKVFGTGGAMANAFGNKSVHASGTMLSKFSMGYAAVGLLAAISSFLRPFSVGCRVVNNLWLNLGLVVVGIGEAVITGGGSLAISASSIAAAMAPLVAIVAAGQIARAIATPILIKTGVHLVLSGIEGGDVYEGAVTAGFYAAFAGLHGSRALSPTSYGMHFGLEYDAAQAQKRALARGSFFDRYLSSDNQDSLFSKVRSNMNLAALTVKSDGISGYAASIGSGAGNKLARAVFPATYAATESESLCTVFSNEDGDNNSANDVATSDFCTVYNERSPLGLDPLESEQLLISNGQIDPNGNIVGKELKEYIKQCTSGLPNPLYKADVADDGSSSSNRTNLCIESGPTLSGETKTIAQAYDTSTLEKPKFAWWQKAIGQAAYAAPAESFNNSFVGMNDRFASWLGMQDDISGMDDDLSGSNKAQSSTLGGTQLPTTTPTTTPTANTPLDCSNAIGNQKIVCAAQQFMGIRYSFTKSDRILKEYGVKSPALPGLRGGANPATWLQNRVVGGPNDFIDCSGYTKLSLYVAYNYQTTAGCSGSYAKDSNGDGLADADPNLMIVPLNQLQPGDFLTISLVCNSETTPGHIAIYVETLPNGKIKTLESTAGKDANGKILSGYREREANYFPYASRYIGPGSPGK